MYRTMIKSANSFSKILVCVAVAVSVSACGSKKVAPTEAAIANSNDITRPPKIIKEQQPVETESNPNETISYDEWRRRRDAERAGSESSPDE